MIRSFASRETVMLLRRLPSQPLPPEMAADGAAEAEDAQPGRINNRWRICFRWERGDAYDVEIVDYHRG